MHSAHPDESAACADCKGNEGRDFWLLDSGASSHFTNCIEDYVHYEAWSPDKYCTLKTANKMTSIVGEGTVLIRVQDPDNGDHVLRIHGVRHVPDMFTRLLSQGKFLQDGMTVSGDERSIHFTRKGRQYVTFHPRAPGDTLYGVNSDQISEDFAGALGSVYTIDYETMHRRMGHPSKEVLKRLRKQSVGFPETVDIPKEPGPCLACHQGKMHQRTFKESTERATRPFQVIHSDLKMYPITSYHGNRYVMVFFDDCTSHAWKAFLKKKSQAVHACRQFLAMVKTQYHSSIEEWRCDQGGEYVGDAFTDLLKDEGIRAKWSPPRTPQINGRAERFMCTFSDKADAMRHQACFPDSWWEFAVSHSFDVYNMTPLERLKWKTPFELIEKKKPDLSRLRVLGCGAYVFVPRDDCKNKLSPRAELMTYIGQGPSGWMFINANGRKRQSATATWDESYFPRCKTKQSSRQTVRVHDTPDPEDSYDTPAPDLDVNLDDGDIPVSGPSKSSSDEQPPTPPGSPPQRTRAQRTAPYQTWGELRDLDKEGSGDDDDINLSPTPARTAPAKNFILPQPDLTQPAPQRGTRNRTQPARFWNNAEKSGGPPETNDQFERRVQGKPPRKTRASKGSESSGVPGPSSLPTSTESTDAPKTPPKPSLAGRLVSLVPATLPLLSRMYGSASDMVLRRVNTMLDSRPDISPELPRRSEDSGFVPREFPDSPTNPFSQKDVAQMCREGGIEMINWLLKAAEDCPIVPKPVREWTYRDVLRLPKDEREIWLGKDGAYAKELEALRERNVFGPLVDLPPGRTIIGNRWVHDIKRDGRAKARFVCQGFSQKPGVDYDQVFSPVVRVETRRLMDAIMALEGWHVEGLDVKSAYLYGELDKEIYIRQPEGFVVKGQERKVIRLNRALYRLKQSGLVWWRTLVKELEKMGFKRIHADAALFIYREKVNRFVIALVYVDNARIYGPLKDFVCMMKDQIKKTWECRDTKDDFLGMRTIRNGRKVYLDQVDYLDKVIERCGQQNAKTVYTPLPAGYVPQANTGKVDFKLRARYQMVIGSLTYIMMGSRPDIAFAVTKMAQHAANPTPLHLSMALYIVRYLKHTRKYHLVYNGDRDSGLVAFSDSDWAADTNTRRSTTGFFLKLAGGIVSWTSRAQRTVALSSTEAEYMALSDCSRQCMWVKMLLEEIGYSVGPVPICGDNQGSIFLASNDVTETRSKHIDIRYHFVREAIEDKKIDAFFIAGVDKPADLFTKPLARPKFERFRDMLGLEILKE
jgi:transposase InsO family protein